MLVTYSPATANSPRRSSGLL